MRKIFPVVCFVVLICLFSCRTQTGDQEKGGIVENGSARVVQLLGNEIIGILTNPDVIKSYKIKINKGEGEHKIAGYPVIARGPDLTTVQRTQLQSVLMDHNTYLFDVVKKCLFLPEYALVFKKGAEEVAVLLCFSCEELTFVYNGREILEDFDNATPKIRALIQELFR